MPSKDDRKINSGIVLHQSATTKGGATVRTWTDKDDFDELEANLTQADLERLTQVDPDTGKAPLEGKWTAGLKERTPMAGSQAHKAMMSGGSLPEPPKAKAKPKDAAALDDLTKDELRALCDKHNVDCPASATKAELTDALKGAGVKG